MLFRTCAQLWVDRASSNGETPPELPEGEQFKELVDGLEMGLPRLEIEAIKADKSIPDAAKKKALPQLQASLKTAKPIQFKENIALVRKYFDKLAPLMQS